MPPASTNSRTSIKLRGKAVPGAEDRQRKIPGFDQDIFSKASVVCVGAGGIISQVAPTLVRKGIGRITLLDDDIVEPSNLNRQRFYIEDLGKNKALALARNLQPECTAATGIRGYALRLQEAIARRIDLSCDVAVCGVDNNPSRVAASRYFRANNIAVTFAAVSRDADHGYVFIQESGGPCIACVFPDMVNDDSYPCPGTPAIADILQAVGALAVYAIGSLLMRRPRTWNYRGTSIWLTALWTVLPQFLNGLDAACSRPITTMRLDQIQVGFRYRKDLGNVRALAQSIAEVGLLHPIVVTPEGRLIAGQRRLEACRRLGWNEVPVTVVDLLQAVRGEAHENFVRKEMLPSEIVALKRAIEPLERRAARERQGHGGTSDDTSDARDKIARYLGVGRTTIDRAEAVIEAADEDPEEYGHLVEQMGRSGKVGGAYRRLTVLKQAKDLEAAPPQLPTGPFQVIVADPPWRYESGASLPYPTMELDAIKALSVREIADENAILWLWTTNAHLRVAFDVVEAWGFEYKTLLTWVKDRMGTGEWLRGQTEHCMLAVRGKPVFLHGHHSTVLEAVRREHSRKPEEFYVLVETTCPGWKVELFARQQRQSWRAFGNDIE